MRLTIASLRRVVKGDLAIQFVPQALTSYGGLELLRRYLRRIDLTARLRQAFAGLPSDYGSARARPGAARPVLRRGPPAGASPLPERRPPGHALLRPGPAADPPHRGELAPAVHAGDPGPPRGAQPRSRDRGPRPPGPAPGHDRRRRLGDPDRGHRRLGLPRVQPASSEGSELLPAPGPRRADRPHPPAEEPAGQCPRLQAGGPVPAGGDRRPAPPARPARGAGVPHGRGLLPARDSRSCSPPGTVATRSRSGTGAGCRSRRSRPPAAGGSRSPRASPATRRNWSSPSGTTCGSAWSSTGSTSPTRRAGTSSWICSRPTTAITSTPPSPRTWRSGPRPCGRSPAAEAPRRRPSPNSRASTRSTSCPTKHYAANSAWQQLGILAHNLIRSFQLDTVAEPKPRSRKRTYAYVFRSLRTLRFLLIARAGRLTRLGGRNVLRLTENPATEALYGQVAHRLAA